MTLTPARTGENAASGAQSADTDTAGASARRPGGPRALRTAGGRISFVVRPRIVSVYAGLLAATVAVFAVSLSVGEYSIPLPRVLWALAGEGERLDLFFVRDVRLPRAWVAVLVGAALGISGGVFQSLSRNPLGSPDIIGFTGGASTGAVATILVLGGSMVQVSIGAMAGGVATAVLVYLLALKQGVQGYRLVLVGIGINALLLAVRDYLMTRAELTEALTAHIWMIGSLNATGWGEVVAVALACAVLVPAILALGPRLRLMEMGEQAARGLGVPVQGTQVTAMLAASALTGAAIAVAGPISFIALAAPQLVRRLARTSGTALLGAALMGALLLAAADLAAQHVLAPTQLPVGVVTAVIGGSYLVWVLYREWRTGNA
ncbi:FecCD family ABC transporter permease [Streptomonospora litoralis]|uniref:Ferric enterobactin transport system permease protein FepG n=1 Tax=Streptomonospora litoralis TaxID=2498135 RepID=A0A4P6PW47_9ACTN|nr:iron chelate uptake ABC transporter family permease subunit [Streptomonospora litoralis]QBI52378.1 Ferric enterobactin transport system permease protein FepG [Streptomonospora litoralis]